MTNPIKPTGWQVLIKIRKAPEKIGGILLPDDSKAAQQFAAVVGEVLEVGPLAWADTHRYGDAGPWAQPGDWVIVAKFGGKRFKVNGEEYRLINDDEVIGTTDKPEEITFA